MSHNLHLLIHQNILTQSGLSLLSFTSTNFIIFSLMQKPEFNKDIFKNNSF